VLVVPEVVVGCRGGTWWTTRISGDGGRPAARRRTPVRAPGAVRFADGSRSSAGWTSVVADAVDRVVAGEVAKVVLARDLEARTEQPLDVRWPLRRLAADYPECRTFSVDGLFGATPEVYVRLERGVATSRVLAGTIRRSGDSARDVEQASSLARSSKDLEEHEYAVRSVADALAPTATPSTCPTSPSSSTWPTSCTSRPTCGRPSPTVRPPWRSWPRCTPPRPSAAPRPPLPPR
jgi:menaquinone-specific isochorismate synthase